MLYCTLHGRAHYPGEADDARLLGDENPCREEEWNVVEGEAQVQSSEPASEAEFVVGRNQLAYLDTVFSGLVPVKVLAIRNTETDMHPEADVKVTATRPGYTRGETLTMHMPNHTLIGRDQVVTRRGQLYVFGPTRFLTDEGELL
jgi:hypothetical protein